MRFLARCWWVAICGHLVHPHPDSLGPVYSGGSPHALGFIHSRSLAGHAVHVTERKAAAAAAGPAGAAAFKLLARAISRLLLFFGSILPAIAAFYYDAISMLLSTPRTARICMWAVRSGLGYRRLLSRHLDHESEAFAELLAEAHNYWASQLAAVCRANGGVYVKCGQFAVAFGAVPREYRLILAQLEDKARPQPYRAIRALLVSELGCKRSQLVGPAGRPGVVFSEFEKTATAAASLAQVHRARLSNGEEVAVKLQYPGLRRAVKADLIIMKSLSAAAKWAFPEFSLSWLIDEMESKLKVELDFRNELHNANVLRSFLVQSKAPAAVPKIHEELSTPSMIIMEWIQGTKLTDVGSLQEQDINPRAVGVATVRLFAELMFVHGYIHGDPHPGNLMVRPKGRRSFLRWLFRRSRQGFEIVLLDHGTYLTLSPQLRQQFAQLWCSFATANKGVQKEVGTAIAGERAGKILPLLLTKSAKTRKEEKALQAAVGINNISDMSSILATAPRDLVELLRINTVIRSSTFLLGVPMSQRVRIFTWYARRGLPRRDSTEPHVHPTSRSLLYHMRLLVLLATWTAWSITSSAFTGCWGVMLSVFQDMFFDH